MTESAPPMRNVEVRLFAAAADAVGRDRVSVRVPVDATVQALLEAVAAAYPPLAGTLPTLLVAVDHSYVRRGDRIPAAGEIACFPPVSGG